MSDRMICMLSNYAEFHRTLKKRIRAVQAEAALSVNRVVSLFWHIGHKILKWQATEQWDAKIIDWTFADIRYVFSDLLSFS